MVFGSGYLANIGIIATLMGANDAVFVDETSERKSYEVFLEGAALRWRDGGRIVDREPDATRMRLAIAAVVRHLPIKRQL
mgnify:CR=1 FL=1